MIKWTRLLIKPFYKYTKTTQPRIELEAEEEDCWLKFKLKVNIINLLHRYLLDCKLEYH